MGDKLDFRPVEETPLHMHWHRYQQKHRALDRQFRRDLKISNHLLRLCKRRCTIRWWPSTHFGVWVIFSEYGHHVSSSRSIRVALEEGLKVIRESEDRRKR